MIWTKGVTRKEFADLLQTQAPASVEDVRRAEGRLGPAIRGEVALLWKHDPRERRALPSAAVVPEVDLREFFAWIATYVPTARPITAYCRVIDPDTAAVLFELDEPPSLDGLEDICLGLILGEGATYAGTHRELRALPPTALYSTLSYSLARAIALHFPPSLIQSLPPLWSKGRSLVSAPVLPTSPDMLLRAWSVVAAILQSSSSLSLFNEFTYVRRGKPTIPSWQDVPEPVLRACEELIADGAISTHTWYLLGGRESLLDDVPNAMRGPREGRVALLEAALRDLKYRTPSSSRDGFSAVLFGFLASAISPGTFDHLQLLTPLLPVMPDVLLWYGLAAGLSRRRSSISFANGLGRRILRELLREEDFLTAPSCDIALSELEVFSKSSRDIGEMRIGTQAGLTVELVPCVNATYRTARPEESQPTSSPLELTETIRDLDRHLGQLTATVQRIRRMTGAAESNRMVESGRNEKKPKKRASEKDRLW